MLPPLDIYTPLYERVVAETVIVTLLGSYVGSPSVHTMRPAPEGAEFPMVIIGPQMGRSGTDDGINDHRPVVAIDLSVYGQNPQHYEVVEQVAELLFGLFHDQRNIEVPGYQVVRIVGMGPYPAPADDAKAVGRRVSLTINLRTKFL